MYEGPIGPSAMRYFLQNILPEYTKNGFQQNAHLRLL